MSSDGAEDSEDGDTSGDFIDLEELKELNLREMPEDGVFSPTPRKGSIRFLSSLAKMSFVPMQERCQSLRIGFWQITRRMRCPIGDNHKVKW